jgi:hypothetical protein
MCCGESQYSLTLRMGGSGPIFREAGNSRTVWCACDDVDSRNKEKHLC